VINTSLTGMRCRATKEIKSHHGLTAIFATGTIQYAIDNFGRQLISVEWDNGVTDYVFPPEIEIIDLGTSKKK
jgi:hypothetical protein